MVAVGSFYKFGQAKNTVKKSDILDITTNKLPGFSVQSSLYEYQCMTITLHQLVNVTYCDNIASFPGPAQLSVALGTRLVIIHF